MRPGTILGALLVLAGVIALSTRGFSFTTREKVAEVGPIQVTTDRERSIPLPPLLAGLAIAGGVVLIVVSSRPSR